jgi:hypothetical protein
VPGALLSELAPPSTERRQTGLATKSNTRSSIIGMIDGNGNSSHSRRRTTRSGEWRKRFVRTKNQFRQYTARSGSSSRTMRKRRRPLIVWSCSADQTSWTPTWTTSSGLSAKSKSFFRDNTTPQTPASPEEVRGIIGFLKVTKAPGPDKIPNTALKLLPDKAVVALTAIINASLRFCHFPSRWKSANVIFIPKPGKDLLFPQNYHPNSLLSNVGKVLEKVILTRLVRATNENHVLPDEQFGFRPKHSTADQLIHVTEFISQGINQNKSTGSIFLDVAKAFDTVWHDGLVYKLHTAGVSLAMVKLLNSFLEDRKFHAKIGNVLSAVREIEAGVPQGSVLSPTLYAIFTADIPKNRRNKDRTVRRRHRDPHAL